MVFSVWFYANIQWHWTFFYSFFVHKFFEYFWKTCKKPLLKQNFSLIKVNFGQLWLKFRTNHWAIFSIKKLPNTIKNHPNGEISPNLVTLLSYHLQEYRKKFVNKYHPMISTLPLFLLLPLLLISCPCIRIIENT